jgi:hypothetical protein
MMLIAMMRMVASESRWLKRAAPSMEPQNSASRATCLAAARAWSALMRPVFRSESIAICLPGMASRVKRAVTSAVRTAPWLTTRY